MEGIPPHPPMPRLLSVKPRSPKAGAFSLHVWALVRACQRSNLVLGLCPVIREEYTP